MNCLAKLEAFLRENQVPFHVQHHPVAYTAQQLAATEHISGKLVAKTVIALAEGKMVMLVTPANRRVDFQKVADLLGVKEAHLAHESDFAATFPDCDVGAMPPFGNMYGLPVYVDAALARDESIVFPAGTHTDTIGMKFADYERLVQPKIADFSRGG